MNVDLITECAKRVLKDNTTPFELSDNTVTVNGLVYPLSPWRFNRQITEMRNLAIKTRSLRDLCSYKSQRVDLSGKDIYELLYEELDTCEWILNDKIVSIYADINADKYITMILKTKRGILCNIIISATLPTSAKPITKHEIVGMEGMISDRTINEQIPAEAVYLFSEEKNATYTDNDLYMLGLTPREIMIADNIIDIVSNKPDFTSVKAYTERNEYLVNCVKKSAKKGNIVIVGEV